MTETPPPGQPPYGNYPPNQYGAPQPYGFVVTSPRRTAPEVLMPGSSGNRAGAALTVGTHRNS